jgi:hypothetical protein
MQEAGISSERLEVETDGDHVRKRVPIFESQQISPQHCLQPNGAI